MRRSFHPIYLSASLFILACGNGSRPRAGLRALRSGAATSASAPSLGAADSFSVLGGSTVTNTGPTVLQGDLGLSPGSAATGFPPGGVLGTMHVTDSVAAQAQSDTTTAYDALAGEPCTEDLTGQDLAGKKLVAGVYCFTSAALLTGALTLDAQGDPSSVFIFKTVSELTAASGSVVELINGADSCNVFWKVGSSATVNTGSSFVGTIVALTSIALKTGANLDGRALARNGAVTLENNQVTSCSGGAIDGGVDGGPGMDGGGGDVDGGNGGDVDGGNGGGGGGATRCEGICTDLDTDANNCGECGVRCSDSQVCRGGTCGACPEQDTQCKEQCADLKNDNDNCGACGNVCTGANGTCVAGVCSACGDGATLCGGNACVWLDQDHDNCGACGNACGADQCCVNSQCTGSSTGGGATSCKKH